MRRRIGWVIDMLHIGVMSVALCFLALFAIVYGLSYGLWILVTKPFSKGG
jgi:hypothetical protein